MNALGFRYIYVSVVVFRDLQHIFLDNWQKTCSVEHMQAQVTSHLYAWSKDLEASSDVLLREVPAFAMLLGWSRKGLCPTRLISRKGLCPTRLEGRVEPF